MLLVNGLAGVRGKLDACASSELASSGAPRHAPSNESAPTVINTHASAILVLRAAICASSIHGACTQLCGICVTLPSMSTACKIPWPRSGYGLSVLVVFMLTNCVCYV